MSIRILALLQGKTLTETKNRTLKCLKRHYSTVRSMKNVAVLTEDGAFALFFRPHPREFAIQGKKDANARGSARGGAGRRWNWLMHNQQTWLHKPEKLYLSKLLDIRYEQTKQTREKRLKVISDCLRVCTHNLTSCSLPQHNIKAPQILGGRCLQQC